MNVLASERGSGCDSGWTFYLEISSHRTANGHGGGFCEENYCEEKKYSVKENIQHDEEEEEDLSMVSDASSGPPQFNEDEVFAGYFNDVEAATTTKLPNNNGGKRLKNKEQRHRVKEKLPSFLDDTASSPLVNLPSKGRSAFQEHFGFLQPSLSGNHLQNNQWY